MRTILVLALKDLNLLRRDYFALFWILVFPLLYALFFGAVFSSAMSTGARALPIVVIDLEQSAGSQAFIDRLDKSPALKLDKTLNLEQAKRAVGHGKQVAYLVLQEGFDASAGLFGGPGKKMDLGVDPSRKAEAGLLKGLILQTAFSDLAKAFPDAAKMVQIQEFEVTGDGDQPRNAFEIMFPSSVLWAIMGCVATFAISIVVERTQGTLIRLRAAPMSRAQLLGGKGLSCFLTSATVTLLLLLFGSLCLGVRLEKPLHLALAIVSTAFCFTGLMMFFSTLGKTESGVAGAGWGCMMPLAMLGGAMVPLIAMPPWLVRISSASPVKWGILALEGAIWRPFSLLDMILPCAILLAVGAAFYALGSWSLSKQDV